MVSVMDDVEQKQSDWTEWRHFILAELKSLRANQDAGNTILQDLRIEFAKLDERAKASGRVAGAIWGMVSGLSVVLAEYIIKLNQ